MEAIGLYLLKSSIVSGIFYLIYYLLLRKESFFNINRFYLIISLIFSYLFPIIRININAKSNAAVPIITKIQSTVNQFSYSQESQLLENTTQANGFDYSIIAKILLVVISIIVLFRFIQHLIQIQKTIDGNKKITHQKFTLVLFNQQYSFSFFRYIFISQTIWDTPESKNIINHELSHLNRNHSLDRLFLELILIPFWMNPFLYLYRKALEEVHEYQADSDATRSTSIKDYFELVVKESASQYYSPLMSPFSYKLIKKRIKMANYKSKPIKRLFLIAPLFVAALFILSSAKVSLLKTSDAQEIITWPTDERTEDVFIFDYPADISKLSSVATNEKSAIANNQIFPILINSKGTLLVNGAKTDFNNLNEVIMDFITNPQLCTERELSLLGKQNIHDGVIYLKKDLDTDSNIANNVLQEINDVYSEIRNQSSNDFFGVNYDECNNQQMEAIKALHPMRLIIAPSKNMAKTKVTFIVPIAKNDLTRKSSGYGMRIHPILKAEKMHNGIDYTAPTDTKVLATADGTIRMVKNNHTEGEGYGKYIIIDHAEGYSSLYAQLNGYNVKEGQTVKQGDTIGFVGSSGISTGPHLHFEIKKDGQHINPESVIK